MVYHGKGFNNHEAKKRISLKSPKDSVPENFEPQFIFQNINLCNQKYQIMVESVTLEHTEVITSKAFKSNNIVLQKRPQRFYHHVDVMYITHPLTHHKQ